MINKALVDLLIDIMIISLGIVARVSPIQGWKSARPYWLYLVIPGSLLLAFHVYKLF